VNTRYLVYGTLMCCVSIAAQCIDPELPAFYDDVFIQY